MRTVLRTVCVLLLLVEVRSALAHWPDQAQHQIAHLGEFHFEGGGMIPDLMMSYVTHGKLHAAKDNAILFMHGFGLNHHQADHLIGPGRPLDTDKYFIICTDELGNTQTTFEHSSSPTNSGLKANFPPYNLRDRASRSASTSSKRSRTTAGAKPIRRTPSGSSPCGCTK